MMSSGLYCPRAGIVSRVLSRLASKNGDRMLPWKLIGSGSSSRCCFSQTIGLSNNEKSGIVNWQSSRRLECPGDVWWVCDSVCISIPPPPPPVNHHDVIMRNYVNFFSNALVVLKSQNRRWIPLKELTACCIKRCGCCMARRKKSLWRS